MEFVYVVPREALFPSHFPQGFLPFAAPSGEAGALALEPFLATIREQGFFVERPYAERTPALKQVIPYSVVRTRGVGPDQVLLLRRLAAGGERRLHDKLSIGVGGHVNPEDLGVRYGSPTAEGGPRDVVAAGTRRELEEELSIDGTWSVRPVGILNDDSNPVGAVHVGLAQVVTVEGRVAIREAEQLEGRLVPPDELRALISAGADFETWSRLLIGELDALLGAPSAGAPRSVLPASTDRELRTQRRSAPAR
jgi:predicted NUDIX family phosphoesterase